MPTCSSCGLSLTDNAPFCPTCGASAGGDRRPQVDPPSYSAASQPQPYSSLPVTSPATRDQSALLSGVGPRIAIVAAAVGAMILVGFILGSSLRHADSVAGQSVLAAASLAAAAITFVATAGSLYIAAAVRGYNLTVKQVLGVGALCGLVTLVPWVGGIASIVVLYSCIQWWTAADWIETVILIFVSRFVAAIISIPFGIGLGLGQYLG